MKKQFVQKDYSKLKGEYQLILPMSTEILIPIDEPARLLSAIAEEMDYSELEAAYSRRGRIGYSPKNLFKIIIYANMRNIRSTRKIEQACRENINFMYLLEGGEAPDHNTISRFRRYCMGDAAEGLMHQLTKLLLDLGEISLAEGAVFIDGTKIEANANRYSFVWKKSVIKYRERLHEKIRKELPVLLSRLGMEYHIPEEIKAPWLKKLRKRLCKQKKEGDVEFVSGKGRHKPPLQKALEKAEEWLKKEKECNQKLHICGDRNSYSKIDHDATFMRMKEDHMRNGQLKPGYNVNVATSSEYILDCYVSQDRTDTAAFIPFMDRLLQKYNLHRIVVDSGYESEENYKYCEAHPQLLLFVKPSNHEQRKTRKYKADIGRRENMEYDSQEDTYICAQGRKLRVTEVKQRKSSRNFPIEKTIYQCDDCKDCPCKEKCIRQSKSCKTPLENRVKRLEVSKYFAKQREEMEKKISTEEGILLRVNRSIQAEGVFAYTKEDLDFRKFLLRGIGNVSTECFLIAIAHNVLKLHHKIQKDRLGSHLIVPKVS